MDFVLAGGDTEPFQWGNLTAAAGVNEPYITQDQGQESQSSEGFHGGLLQY